MSQLQQHLVACGVVLVTCLYLTAPSHASSCPFLARKIDGTQGTTHPPTHTHTDGMHTTKYQGRLAEATNRLSPLFVHDTGNQQSGWQGQIPGANNASDPLCAMNTYFHAVYDAVGEAIRPVPRILLVITQWLLCEWSHLFSANHLQLTQ